MSLAPLNLPVSRAQKITKLSHCDIFVFIDQGTARVRSARIEGGIESARASAVCIRPHAGAGCGKVPLLQECMAAQTAIKSARDSLVRRVLKSARTLPPALHENFYPGRFFRDSNLAC